MIGFAVGLVGFLAVLVGLVLIIAAIVAGERSDRVRDLDGRRIV